MRGARRVVAFCLLAAAVPMMLVILPLYLRNIVFAERGYSLMQSDVLSVSDGISSVFCQGHKLRAREGWFSSHQMATDPGISDMKREITIEKKMSIPDDRLEYWGFHLLPNSTLKVAVCASSPGARLLVVRGEKNLELCGLLRPQISQESTPPALAPRNEETPQVTFEEHPAAIPEEPSDPAELENTAAEVTDEPFAENENSTAAEEQHPHRHARSRMKRLLQKKDGEQQVVEAAHFEHAIEHGGNADMNFTEHDGDVSQSSFETGLLECFQGNTLIQRGFEASSACQTETWPGTLHLSQTIKTQGNFYYVFYSDNDLDINHIKARFHVNSSRFEFSASRHSCLNTTECAFQIGFFGGDGTVYVEADSDVELLSVCEPRIAVYLLFPASALVFVLIFGLL